MGAVELVLDDLIIKDQMISDDEEDDISESSSENKEVQVVYEEP